MTSLSKVEMCAELNRQIEAAGGQGAWCRKVGVSQTVVSLVQNGHREMPEAVANACGYISELKYRQIRG